ncbi:uncharacterized protein B0T15DRAFT_82807 [Chaetomium strumarium]|uniref:Uncharacterized protein n=1 Tax=Chaetomium strumarium TaxID=1170767 RepID=A0AAJ0H4I5_9PEZI|nr:hypothetical protein B0T15DRAFT_82807 [Chaetomium strumarium]
MASDEATEVPYELCVQGPTDDQPVRLKLGFRDTVAKFLSQMAERHHAAPEKVFLVVDGNLTEALLPFAHKPDLTHSYPMAQLVPHGGKVGIQIGLGGASAFGPFILGPPTASHPTAVTGDTYEITHVIALDGAKQMTEAEVTRTGEKIRAVIQNVYAAGSQTKQYSRIMTADQLKKTRILDMMEENEALKGVDPQVALQKMLEL